MSENIMMRVEYAPTEDGKHSAYVVLGPLMVWGHGKTREEAAARAREKAHSVIEENERAYQASLMYCVNLREAPPGDAAAAADREGFSWAGWDDE